MTDLYLHQLQPLFDNHFSCVYFKDTDLIYRYINPFTAQALRCKNNSEILGKKDEELIWQDYSPAYQRHDQDTLNGKSYMQLDAAFLLDGEKAISLSMKKTVRDEQGKIAGVLGIAQLFVNKQLGSLLATLKNNAELKINVYPNYLLDDNALLCRREAECLFYLLHGKSAKSTGELLNISPKSVESYLSQIKQKWSCDSREDLFEKAYELGYFAILPQSLFHD